MLQRAREGQDAYRGALAGALVRARSRLQRGAARATPTAAGLPLLSKTARTNPFWFRAAVQRLCVRPPPRQRAAGGGAAAVARPADIPGGPSLVPGIQPLKPLSRNRDSWAPLTRRRRSFSTPSTRADTCLMCRSATPATAACPQSAHLLCWRPHILPRPAPFVQRPRRRRPGGTRQPANSPVCAYRPTPNHLRAMPKLLLLLLHVLVFGAAPYNVSAHACAPHAHPAARGPAVI
jgi:hypothetical protein